MTSDWMGEMFEGDSADEKFPLSLMGGWAEDFNMGLLLGMRQNKTPLGENKTLLGVDKTLTDSQQKDWADQLQ